MQSIGIIGFGNMGQAIASRLCKNYDLHIFDINTIKTKGTCGLRIHADISSVVISSDTLILAVKPQDFDSLLESIKYSIDGKLVISIAAGITTEYIERKLGHIRVVRVMPNMPAQIGEGVICLSAGKFTKEMDLDLAVKLFSLLGETLKVNENLMNAVTAVSGSGPAYVCEYINSCGGLDKVSDESSKVFLKEFRAAAVEVGFSEQEAALLVDKTFSGTVNFIRRMKVLPEDLEIQVASKGGTTEAALSVLRASGTLSDAVKAALKRADELSRRK